MTNETLERQIIELVATDRIYKPISSMGGKLERSRPKLAQAINLNEFGGKYNGERVFARVEAENEQKARGMKEGIEMFKQKYPKLGSELQGMIDETREQREVHLYFGVQEGKKLSADDYMGVMRGMGFSEGTARSMYPELMEVSRQLAQKRKEKERGILIG